MPNLPRVLCVDPSLFTPTYDRALSDGLIANGVEVSWAARATRVGEDEDDLKSLPQAVRFYRYADRGHGSRGTITRIIKGLEHYWGLKQLERAADAFDVVHFQWTPLPILDAPSIRRISKRTPVVLTVHDIVPLNGARGVQVRGFDRLFAAADQLIVHTDGARASLIARGVDAGRVSVIPHGPLTLRRRPTADERGANERWRIVLFGRLKPYKGVDLLVEAMGRLSADDLSRIKVVVAGEPSMPVQPILDRALALGLDASNLEFIFKRLTDQEVSDLLHSADSFVFPYKTIDASGVLFLVLHLNKWIIASPIGAFKDLLEERPNLGLLVEPVDAEALGRALVAGIGRTPPELSASATPSWTEIGAMTLKVYRSLS